MVPTCHAKRFPLLISRFFSKNPQKQYNKLLKFPTCQYSLSCTKTPDLLNTSFPNFQLSSQRHPTKLRLKKPGGRRVFSKATRACRTRCRLESYLQVMVKRSLKYVQLHLNNMNIIYVYINIYIRYKTHAKICIYIYIYIFMFTLVFWIRVSSLNPSPQSLHPYKSTRNTQMADCWRADKKLHSQR